MDDFERGVLQITPSWLVHIAKWPALHSNDVERLGDPYNYRTMDEQ